MTDGDPQDFFTVDDEFLVVALPVKISRSIAAQIDSAAKPKLAQMNDSWARKLILDLRAVADINMNVIQLIIHLFADCAKSKIPVRMVASDAQADALSGFQETGSIQTEPTVEMAKGSL